MSHDHAERSNAVQSRQSQLARLALLHPSKQHRGASKTPANSISSQDGKNKKRPESNITKSPGMQKRKERTAVRRIFIALALSAFGGLAHGAQVYIHGMSPHNYAACIGNYCDAVLRSSLPQPAGTVRVDAEVQTQAGFE